MITMKDLQISEAKYRSMYRIAELMSDKYQMAKHQGSILAIRELINTLKEKSKEPDDVGYMEVHL